MVLKIHLVISVVVQFHNPSGTDTFISQVATYGPIVSRLIEADMIDDPLFSVRFNVR